MSFLQIVDGWRRAAQFISLTGKNDTNITVAGSSSTSSQPCASCYTLKRQDAEYFSGLREAVLERDGYRCRVCNTPGGRKREMIVHHRIRGIISGADDFACLGCHASIHRTKAALGAMPPLVLKLWREQQPKSHEQVQLDFSSKRPAARAVPLFR